MGIAQCSYVYAFIYIAVDCGSEQKKCAALYDLYKV